MPDARLTRRILDPGVSMVSGIIIIDLLVGIEKNEYKLVENI